MFSSNTTQVSSGGYQISRSLRFNSADSAYLNRTPASASNQKTWTWSGWFKRSAISTYQRHFSIYNASDSQFTIGFDDSNRLELFQYTGSFTINLVSTAVYRDPSAWYHLVVSIDTTQATSTNRVQIYVNGIQVTAFSTATYPTQNLDTLVNATSAHFIGQKGSADYFNGYMTEINFVNAQQLTPSSFGETNAQTGVWQPKAYSGSYGTNGFYLNFSDNSNTTAATLGKDYSGNGNNWTPNGFLVSAGVNNDSLVDSPTSYGTDTGVGGTVRGNYATLNPLSVLVGTTSNGNLDGDTGTTNGGVVYATMNIPNSGKWYWEYTQTNTGTSYSGIETVVSSTGASTPNNVWYIGDGTKQVNGTTTSYGSSYGNTDIIGTAVDVDAGTVTFYKNGTSQGAITYATASINITPSWRDGSGSVSLSFNANFGQRPFAYTAPSGFKALCTQNLPTPTIGATTATQAGKYFNPVLYTGTGSSQSITGVGFQPDWVWAKLRAFNKDHILADSVRGGSKVLNSNNTLAEVTGSWITAFNSDGFTVGTEAESNANGAALVAWNWKGGGTGVSNTAGSITSTVSANTTSGFSVVTYTGNGSAATIGHGLGVAPSMYIVKNRTGTADEWVIYHANLTSAAYYLTFTTGSQNSNNVVFNSTAPTSTVFSVGTSRSVNTTTYVAYCFAPVAGYSAFGKYTGNGSADGPFVFTGFRPAYVMIKNISLASAWIVYDNKRNTANVETNYLLPNSSGAETTLSSLVLDFTSNGFKIRGDQGTINTSNDNYIYACFAETPLKFSLAR